MISDAGMMRNLPGRARLARALFFASIGLMIVQMFYEGAAELSVSGADFGSSAWTTLDLVGTVATFASVVALAAWASALTERVRLAWPNEADRLPTPSAMAWIVFFFPVTLFFPWLYLRRMTRIVGRPKAGRLVTGYYAGQAGVAVIAFAAFLLPVDRMAYTLGDLAYLILVGAGWVPLIVVTVLLLPLIGQATAAAMEGDVGEVFA